MIIGLKSTKQKPLAKNGENVYNIKALGGESYES